MVLFYMKLSVGHHHRVGFNVRIHTIFELTKAKKINGGH